MFQSTHQCRTKDGKLPQPLVDAYASAGTVWRGTKAVEEYVAKAPPSSSSKKTPSVLVLRGEHDFVTHACVKDWKDLFNTSRSVREKEIPGCSHHGLLENGPLYGDIIDSFFGEYD